MNGRVHLKSGSSYYGLWANPIHFTRPKALTGTLSVGTIIALLLGLQEWTLVLVLLHLREAMFLGYVGAAVQFSHSNLTKRQVTI